MTQNNLMVTGCVMAALGVIMGAFGAHGLESQLSADRLEVYKTAVDYHLYHALGLIVLGTATKLTKSSLLLSWSANIMLAGIVLFSGSLYLLTLTGLSWLGAVAPFGGTAFIIAWLLFAIGMWRER
jgi:uncharacterized membrane protein YgdD (TMEM256/DUF423 family)